MFLAGVLEVFLERIFQLPILEGECAVVFGQQFTIGSDETHVHRLHPGLRGDVLEDREVELQFLYLREERGLFVTFVQSGATELRHFQHGGAADDLGQFGLLLGERLILLLHGSKLFAHFAVLTNKLFVLTVKRVNLMYILHHHLTDSGKFLLEGVNLLGISSLGDTEFLAQVLHALFLLRQKVGQRVVFDVDLIPVVLQRQIFILFFELFFLKLHCLRHGVDVLLLLMVLDEQERYSDNENSDNSN